MDWWKTKELKVMELGGNKRAGEYYKKHGMVKDGTPHHEHAALSAYKANLLNEALKEIGDDEVAHAPAPVSGGSHLAEPQEERAPLWGQEPVSKGLDLSKLSLGGASHQNPFFEEEEKKSSYMSEGAKSE